MSPVEDKDKYVVYHGIEDGAATFSLFDTNYENDRLVRQITLLPNEIPDGIEYQDHFWVQIEDGEIVELQFDSELTEQKLAEAQDAAEVFEKWQEMDEQKRTEEDG